MLKLTKESKLIKVVNDQVPSSTYNGRVCEKIVQLIYTKGYGLYHVANNGEFSWYDFAKAIFKITILSPNLSPITTEKIETKALRPKYSVLDNKKFQKSRPDDMKHWKKALREYLIEKDHLMQLKNKR